jgi:hypothetical protein
MSLYLFPDDLLIMKTMIRTTNTTATIPTHTPALKMPPTTAQAWNEMRAINSKALIHLVVDI